MKKSKSQKATGGEKPAGEKEIADDLSGKPEMPEEFLVVGIGASAGGIQALKEFFEHVPADSGMAYVVILHLSPDHDSRLAEVLQTVAPIPVSQVTKKIKVEPNRVYVVSPNEHLEMFDGHIVVTTNISIEERRAPVDIFFRTLAESHHARAVAVVLSGTGANGSMGIKRVKERGGAAFVQNPREAEFSEMPRNSIATDLIDQILNVADIPARIIAYKESLGKVEISVEPEHRPEEQQHALREIFTALRLRTGHDFSNYKRPTILRRIERRINVFNLPDLTAYAVFMHDNRDEANALLKDLLISVTNFFRDKQTFEFLEIDVLPKLFHGKRPEDQVRIWVAGCATGEEAYTLAMLCAEITAGVIDAPGVQIFASDIDEQAIATAREGFYTLNDAADVSPERLRRFFTKEGNGYRVRRELRELILFANHNAIKDPPFSKLDLATCRNMLIYLNQTAQERVMEMFHFALNPGGYLFLGNSESTDGAGDLYATLSKEHHVFQSRSASGRVFYPAPESSGGRFQNREFGSMLALPSAPATLATTETDGGTGTALQRQSFGDLHQQLLEQYAAPSIVVNEEFDIVHLSERAGQFLQIAGGELTKNLLKLILPELRLELRAGLYQAVQNQTNVEIRNLKINRGDERINIYARPVLQHSDDTARGFILVLFEPARGDSDSRADAAQFEELNALQEPFARQFEEELVRTKSQLRGTIEQFEIQAEELKASNEELQAMNEELRSAAEELETSKEELQSVNEELITVNQELKVKLEELSLSNNDFQNLINSTDIATIFLDRSFRVHTFTPAASRIFNLIPADFGRPLTDITHRLETDDLLLDAEKVLDTLQTVEREARTIDERTYLLRVLPYRTSEDRIGGVVATFLDITERKRAEDKLRESETRQAFLLKLADAIRPLSDAVEIQRTAMRVLGEHLQADRVLYSEIETDDRHFVIADNYVRGTIPKMIGRFPLSEYDNAQKSQRRGETFVLSDIRSAGESDEHAAFLAVGVQALIGVPLHKDGRWVASLSVHHGSPRQWSPEDAALVGETAERTWAAVERAHAEEKLIASHDTFRQLVENSPFGIYVVDADFRLAQVGKGAQKVFENISPLIGRDFAEILRILWQEPFASKAIAHFRQTLETGEPYHSPSTIEWRGDIDKVESYDWKIERITLPNGRFGVVCHFYDLSERQRYEAEIKGLSDYNRNVLESISDPFFTLDREWRFTYMSAEGEKLVWREPGELIGKSIWEEFPGFIGSPFEKMYRDAMEGNITSTVADYFPDHDRWYEVTAYPSPNGATVYFKDTSQSKRNEANLAFLAEVSKDLVQLTNIDETMSSLCAKIGEHFKVARVVFAEIGEDETTSVIRHEWHQAHLPTLKEAAELKNFLVSKLESAQRDGDISYIRDVAEELRDAALTLTQLGIASLLGAPLVRDEKLHLYLGIIHSERREWRTDEIELMRELTARIKTTLERARAEAALRESEGRLRALVENLPGGAVFIIDKSLRYLLAQGEALTTAGFKPEDLIGRTIGEAMPPKLAASYEPMYRQALTGEAFEHEHEAHDRTFISRGVPLTGANGDVYAVLAISYDITERKRAEEALAESEERLRLLIESASDYAIFTLTSAGLIDSWNAGAEKVFGWTETEAVGKSGEIIFTPEDRKKGASEKEMKTALQMGRAPDERFHLRKDGTRFYASGVTATLKDANGIVQGFVKIARDMTEQIEAEKALRDKEMLQKLVGAQEDERTRIARDLHDELGQQLTALRLKLDKARKMCEDESVSAEIDQIDLMAKSIDDGVDFLAWELRPAALDQLGLIAALENYVQQWMQHSGVSAELLISSLKRARFAPEVETNLYRIVQESLNNTHKHAEAKHVEVVLEKRDDWIVLIIEDDGKGFNPKNKRNKSKGIGLIGMKERTQLVGGTLEIESAPGKGTTVFVRIPAAPIGKRGSDEK